MIGYIQFSMKYLIERDKHGHFHKSVTPLSFHHGFYITAETFALCLDCV